MAILHHLARAIGLIGMLGLGASAGPAGAAADQDDPLLLVGAEEASGSVIAVVEPNELRLALSGEEIVVALEDLRLPPESSRLREAGRELLARLLGKRLVRVRVHSSSSGELRRVRGSVFLEGQDVRGELIEAGLAAYCPVRAGDQKLMERQGEALKARRGLWADASAVTDVCGPK